MTRCGIIGRRVAPDASPPRAHREPCQPPTGVDPAPRAWPV